MIRLIFILFSFLLISNNYAQVGFKETTEYLNKKLEGYCTFSYKKVLTIEFYKDGELHHIDKLDIRDLDTNNFNVDYETKIIRIHCQPDFGDCINRELTKDKQKRYYNRIVLDTGLDEKNLKSVEKALWHLIRLAQITTYENNNPFE